MIDYPIPDIRAKRRDLCERIVDAAKAEMRTLT